MEVPKVGLGNYDPAYIQAIRAEMARSIKPNAFRERPDNVVQLALLLADVVELSAEAKLLLKKLRRSQGNQLEDVDWNLLLEELKKEPRKGKERETNREDAHLNLITLPVMRPPLPEVLPRDGNGHAKKSPGETELRKILAKMIVRAPNETIKSKLIDELEKLNAYVINACRNFGVHILLLDRREKISDIRIHGMALAIPGERVRDGRVKDHVRGFYYEDRRLMIVGEEQIGIPGRFVSIHEFAHAYDHTFSEKHYQMHFLSTQLWNLFAPTRKGLITDYAAESPAEYFAESVEGYFVKDSRKWLERNDPQMYEFLSNLFL